ncbi:MAG: hypothetical protein INQ03_13110 [Candidatus Heimdallarchaeota archaeon]|nr:hypothetical protein [Candidatus Heimdallarchaeota archaeon]
MYVHLYSRGEDFFKEKVNVHEACQLIELQQTKKEEEDNFIGFTHPKNEDAVIQFVRILKDEWLIDIPMIDNNRYVGSLVSEINHSLVLIVVTEFFHNTPLQQAILDKKYEDVMDIFKQRWKVPFNFLRSDGNIQ